MKIHKYQIPNYWIVIAPFLFLIIVYACYFLHLTRLGLTGITDENWAFIELGQAILEKKVGKETKFKVAGYAIRSKESCSFMTFEAIRTHCRGVALVVPKYVSDEKDQVVSLTNFIAVSLSKPCKNLDAVPSDRKLILSNALGCTKRNFSYRTIVQAISSESIQMTAGGSYFENHLIYERSISGEI
jgi:hypothetical protein